MGIALLATLLVGCSLRATAERYDQYLHESWAAYQGLYLQPEGYVLDRERDGGMVTSEGQSYALLRALWVGDEETFERVYAWTEEHLARDDGLYSWLWSPADGGVVVDSNTASDGDQDIAFALLLASYVFDRPDLQERAREILQAIRRHEALEMPRGWYPAAGDWAVADRIANLSYFTPYAYPYFDRLDPDGGWLDVLDTGYELVGQALDPSDILLIPDFIGVDGEGQVIPLPPGSEHSSDFSFDAVRIYWRVAVDCLLHSRAHSCSDPAGTTHLATLFERDGRLVTQYAVDGEPLSDGESLSFYGAILPSLRLYTPDAAEAVLAQRLNLPTLEALLSRWDRYYDVNWVWLGIAADLGWIRHRTPSPVEVVP